MEYTDMFRGVPQGAILSPLLFNLMLIDFSVPCNPLIKVLLYTDDVAAHVTAKSTKEAAKIF